MASNLSPAFAYTVVYGKDVAKSVEFYAKAFGHRVRRLDESHRWGDLESWQTTIAFTPRRQHETDDLTGTVKTPALCEGERQPVEVCFAYSDVKAAYKMGLQRAVENRAVPVSEPGNGARKLDTFVMLMKSSSGLGVTSIHQSTTEIPTKQHRINVLCVFWKK